MHKCLRKNHGSFLRFVPEHSGGWGSQPGLAARLVGWCFAYCKGRIQRAKRADFFFEGTKKPRRYGGACSLLAMLCAALKHLGASRCDLGLCRCLRCKDSACLACFFFLLIPLASVVIAFDFCTKLPSEAGY